MTKKNDWMIPLLVLVPVIFIALMVYAKVRYQTFTVPQGGMMPNILPEEVFVVDEHAYRGADDVQRGNVVVFRHERRRLFVWRVIAKPGDVISIEDGIPVLNDKKAATAKVACNLPDDFEGYDCYEEHLSDRTYQIAFKPEPQARDEKVPKSMEPFTVADGQFFLLGDCRNCAADSRYNGPVDFGQILGKAKFFLAGSVHGLGDPL